MVDLCRAGLEAQLTLHVVALDEVLDDAARLPEGGSCRWACLVSIAWCSCYVIGDRLHHIVMRNYVVGRGRADGRGRGAQ